MASCVLTRAIIGVLLALALVLPEPAVAQQGDADFEYLLVGALIGSREGETFEVLRRGGEFFIPLVALIDTCGCELEERDSGPFIVTPLGIRQVGSESVTVVDGIRYVSERFLTAELGTQVDFIEELYALRFIFPWTPGAALRVSTLAMDEALPADDSPAPLALSSVRVNARYTRSANASDSTLNSLFTGRVGGGRWRVGLDQTVSGTTNVREYGWMRTYGQKLVLAGHQRVSLHPLLASMELTGVQGAWTNQPLETFATSSQPTELLPRTLRTATTITGRGPAAGIAELRIDGVPVEVRAITLDGVYEFFEVHLPSRQSSHIEVYVYDRFNRVAPLEIHDHTRGVSDQLLPAGAALVMGGVGLAGNYFGDLINERESLAAPTGFLQSRYGLSDRMTLEATLQTHGDRKQALVGVAGSFGRNFVGSAAVAASGGGVGWDVDVQGYFSRWQVTGRSQQTAAGFSSDFAAARYDHYGEFVFRPTSHLDIGLVAASRYDGVVATEYVLPSLSWQPTARTWLRARPDVFGRYRFDFSWAAVDRARLTAAYLDGNLNVGVNGSVTDSIMVGANSEWDERYGDRQTVQASWVGQSALQPGFAAGISRTRGALGVMLGAQAVVGPGVLVSAQFENDPRYNDPLNRRDSRVTLRIQTDLAFAGGQVLGGSTYALSTTRGAVGGQVKVGGDVELPPGALEGLTVMVDGRAVTRTQRGGRFFVGNLRSGVHTIEIDAEGMPIELNLPHPTRRARVEPGAVTGVDFVAIQEFGFAGRVLVEDQVFARALVELLDLQGELIDSARTDRFGLYRFDGVAVGTYRVRLSPKNAPNADVVWPHRTVTVDDFLFGQDLVLRRVDIHELSVPDELTGGQGAGGGSDSQNSPSNQPGSGILSGVASRFGEPTGLADGIGRPIAPDATPNGFVMPAPHSVAADTTWAQRLMAALANRAAARFGFLDRQGMARISEVHSPVLVAFVAPVVVPDAVQARRTSRRALATSLLEVFAARSAFASVTASRVSWPYAPLQFASLDSGHGHVRPGTEVEPAPVGRAVERTAIGNRVPLSEPVRRKHHNRGRPALYSAPAHRRRGRRTRHRRARTAAFALRRRGDCGGAPPVAPRPRGGATPRAG
jgi:hypothetical protein